MPDPSLASSVRTKIRDAVAARIMALYGATAGTLARLFRDSVSGAWVPQNAPVERASVLDNGQKRAGYEDTETEKSFELNLEIVLDLPANWAKPDQYNRWVDLVDSMITQLQNWLPAVPGMMRCEYEDDDAVNVTLAAGKTVQVWVLHFRLTYMVQVGEIGKS